VGFLSALRRGEEQRNERTRLVFATDLHAAELTFRKFLNAAKAYGADVLILGGDLTGKVVAPLVERDGTVEGELMGERVVARGEDEAAELETRFRNLGIYPVRVTPPEYERIRDDRAYRHALTQRLCLEQVERWLALAEERLGATGIPLFATGGNDDDLSIEPVLERSGYAQNAEGRVLRVDGEHELVSTGYGNITPWRCPRDLSEEELRTRIDETASALTSAETAIFNLHVPPYGSGLDLAAKLDTSVDPPRALMGEMVPAGSTAVRDAIEEYQPLLSLHGHIHESRSISRIGRTMCINPGSEYAEGVLRAAIVDIAGDRVLNAQLVGA
jgi:Icc-related predicted phosphoesterase